MKLLPLHKLGAREIAAGVIDLGLFLPWVSAHHGNRLWVKVIHEKDQFLQEIQPLEFELSHSTDPEYGDYWAVQVDIGQHPAPHPQSAWGTPGRYVYRYCLQNPNTPERIDWIIDPFAREFGVGKLSAFTLGYQEYEWSPEESAWKTPALNDLIFYELMISEFGGSIEGTIQQLAYLADLGVNCIEIMPVSNVTLTIDWGFSPIGHLGVDERFGQRQDLLKLIDAAHQEGLAVIVDAVYGHTSGDFAYQYVYDRLAYHENPFMGPFAKDYYGHSVDYGRKFARDFFYTVNYYWLDRYHVDGLRYDCVPNYWDGSLGQGYANLVYCTYQAVKAKRGGSDHWQRFFDDSGGIHLIQCAEQLEGPQEILEKTYSNCTWQNGTLGAAQGTAHGSRDDLTRLGLQLGLSGYPSQVTNSGDRIEKTALQYIETHDHERFVCNFGIISSDNVLLQQGDRDLWYKVQPYLIGLLTAKGIPLLWQGQEFGENYWLPHEGWGRVKLHRPVRWDYFYDSTGKRVVALVRKLTKLRQQGSQFRRGNHYFYNHYDRYQSRGVLLFSRQDDSAFSLVALNFGDADQAVPFWFPISGDYREELHGGANNLPGIVEGVQHWLTVPSNYGRIWTVET
jgi:maltooligosyltrehalose trehalohydrolase